MEKIQENICKQACSYVFVQDNFIKAHVLMYMYFLHLALTFTPPLHHNGKGSIPDPPSHPHNAGLGMKLKHWSHSKISPGRLGMFY